MKTTLDQAASKNTLGAAAGKRTHPSNSEPRQPWKEDDAKWFQSNPLRDFRLRPAFPGEYPDNPDVDLVLIRQITPGKRTKTWGVGAWLTDRDLLKMWWTLFKSSEGIKHDLLFSPPDKGAV